VENVWKLPLTWLQRNWATVFLVLKYNLFIYYSLILFAYWPFAFQSNEPIFSVTVGFFDDMYISTAFLLQQSALYVSYTPSHFPVIIIIGPESSYLLTLATQMSGAISGS
jgi:hypothetical protein